MGNLSYGLYKLINHHIGPTQCWFLTLFSIIMLKYGLLGLGLLPILSHPNLHLPMQQLVACSHKLGGCKNKIFNVSKKIEFKNLFHFQLLLLCSHNTTKPVSWCIIIIHLYKLKVLN
jgi:hypothetical protein